jgi:hypothetical protein
MHIFMALDDYFFWDTEFGCGSFWEFDWAGMRTLHWIREGS